MKMTCTKTVEAVKPLVSTITDDPNFTPGPWRLLPSQDAQEIVCPSKNGGASRLICDCTGSPLDRPVCEANARLISAAPELLEALSKFAVWNERQPCFCHADIYDGDSWDRNNHGGQCSPLCQQARAAITKATKA